MVDGANNENSCMVSNPPPPPKTEKTKLERQTEKKRVT